MNEEKTWSLLTVLAGVVIVGLVAYQFMVPRPTPKGAIIHSRNEEELSLAQRIAIDKGEKLEASNKIRLWNLGPEALGPMAMARVSNMAKNHSLNMVAFRPMRNQDAGNLVRSGYTISVEGVFPKVIQFARQLETPETKLAVVSLQVTATDGATDTVRATVGVIAYRDREAGIKAASTAQKETKSTLASDNEKQSQ